MDKLRVGHRDILKEQLQNLENVYVKWPPDQQGADIMQIKSLSAGKMPSLSNPLVVMPKARPYVPKTNQRILQSVTYQHLSMQRRTVVVVSAV